MIDTRSSVRPRVVRALVPVLIVLYLVLKTDEWQGDVPAVSVEFPADLPPDVLTCER